MSSSLRNRVAAALTAAAEDVRTEAAATASHTERFTWATGILSGFNAPQVEADRAMWIIVQNATIQASGEASTDNDIQFTVNGLVNFLAGVDTSE
jgi:hypothetical protein